MTPGRQDPPGPGPEPDPASARRGRGDAGPDFIEALARGLDVIRAFGTTGAPASLSDLAQAAGLSRPTTRRILLTLVDLGYVRSDGGLHRLTPRVLELGLAYVSASDLWTLARPHLERLSAATHESCSVAELDGSDIVYVARVAVPKLVALSVGIGTRFPAVVTSLGKVLLAHLPPAQRDAALAEPTRSGVEPARVPARGELLEELARVRDQGWAATDQALAPAVRSVAVPVLDADGRVTCAMNVNAHAMETSMDVLVSQHLPLLREAAAELAADRALLAARPVTTLPRR
ncbi:IclR family transcriptional regulator domain-containing protein [Microlunatus flavus]|uniref:IclR family transcriptional regulator domain-containing protein n=1 Tax=Microlunatus flavus TaxID=1036181 RepID=UPI0018E0C207|nr:IclR family transcriptional regulator C-terminal domain-containing protein [Microlunatus flavus]